MIFDDESKRRINWGKLSAAVAIITGVFGAITAGATAVKTGIEAYEAVKRNMPEKPNPEGEQDEPGRIVIP